MCVLLLLLLLLLLFLGGICVVVVVVCLFVVSEEGLTYGRKFSRRNANVQVNNRVSVQIIKIKQYISLLYRSIYSMTRLKTHYTKLFTSIQSIIWILTILSTETTV